MPRRFVTASVVLASLVLVGCASIPSSGPVQQGEAAPAVPVDVDILVPGPTSDASQQEILEGFLFAAQSPRGNYQVARQFLTPVFAEEWQADAAATIDVLAERDTTVVDETRMRVDATPAASLRDNGQYEEAASAAPIPLKYVFAQDDDGQWRIDAAPPGILIDQANFGQVFRDYPVYFYDPTYRFLVPDLRWYASRESAQTSIVQALLAGPADWLEPGVVSAFPEGLQLEPAAVPVNGGTASVSLAGPGFDDLRTVQRMGAQLDASLVGRVRSIERVDLTVNGADPDAPQLAIEPIENPRVDPRPVVFDGETFGHLATSGESITPIPGFSEQVAILAPTGAAVGLDGESVAVLNQEGVWIIRAGDDAELLDQRANLVVPAIDGEGVVWSVPADAPDQLRWFAPDGTSGPVAVPWSGTAIAAIEVSRDSTRIIGLLADGTRTSFVAAAIRRTAEGPALGEVPQRLASVSGDPLDVAWLDARTVASLTALPDGSTRIVTQELGGIAIEGDGPPAGVLIDGGNSVVRVLTAAGDLNVRSGVGWQLLGPAGGIRLLAAQQPG